MVGERMGRKNEQKPGSATQFEILRCLPLDDLLGELARRTGCDQRPGQAAMNMLAILRPDLARHITDSELDAYHRDDRLRPLLRYLSGLPTGLPKVP